MLFLNEMSLEAQFGSAHAFLSNLRAVMKCQRESRKRGFPLQVRKSIVRNLATVDATFEEIVFSCGDRDFIAQIRIWLMKDGPFWDEPKEHDENQWFECFGELVTDSSLAEASWHSDHGTIASLYSFIESRFSVSPLSIHWKGQSDGDKETSLLNFCDPLALNAYLDTQEQPLESWGTLISSASEKFPGLLLSDSISDELSSRPFVTSIANRAFELLRVLNDLSEAIIQDDVDGEKAILAKYFSGTRAWFSGESEGRRNDNTIVKKMTFRDPRSGNDLYCPYHGKISHQYFRLHFEWPKINRKSQLLIAYLGPHR